jgi:hypothetical protein
MQLLSTGMTRANLGHIAYKEVAKACQCDGNWPLLQQRGHWTLCGDLKSSDDDAFPFVTHAEDSNGEVLMKNDRDE